MKKYVFVALFFTAFMFPFFGSINNADALGNYGCGNPDKRTHVHCLRGLLASTPYGLSVKQSNPSSDGLGNYGCGNPDKRTHVNCLRGLLTSTPYGLTVPKGKNGLGKYGCGRKAGNKTKRKHVNCLRRLLDQHGSHLAKGGAGPKNAPGMHPPMGQPGMPPMGDMDCVNAGNPTEVAACWNAKAHNGPPPGGMPPTGAQPVLPPTGGMPTAAMPPADPCMAVTDPNDIVSCRASHPVTGMGMPPMGQPGMPPMGMPPMGMPPTGAQPVLPPTGGMPTMAIPPTDPCMAVTDANDRAACKASHLAPPMGMPPTMAPGTMPPGTMMPPMGMPPTGMHPPMGQPGMPPMGDPCMVVPAGPDRDACYATTPAPGS